MTDEQIVKLAEAHGLCILVPDAGYEHDALWFEENCMVFAFAVVASERERCADIVLNAAKHGCCCSDSEALAEVIRGA